MIKVTLLLGSLLVLTAAAAVVKINERNVVQGCKSENELWGSDDGTKFYFCLGDNMALEQDCDPGTFFVKNATVSGCVPVDLVDDKCIYHTEPPSCIGESVTQPQPHEDPTKFYLCPASGAEPLVLSCTDNKAFVSQDGYLGCFDWTQWRQIRGCVNDE
ncbi:uncharacterized protein LOC133332108 [Musca vetustissima]|uniref:uncharacterized protein LOC133332108 n=1 Tax=Musca vetustissima TaxID=27455 RepID=UPI002AB7B4C2|nr:uncharacterized protein LOC133332108 [Musca vetustissima]